MKVLVISRNLEYFKNVHRLLSLEEEDILYGRDLSHMEEYNDKFYINGIIVDWPYPTECDLNTCLSFKRKFSHVKMMVLSLEVPKSMKISFIREGIDIFITDPPSICIEKIVGFSELLGVQCQKKSEKISINPGIIFDVRGWKIIKNGERISLPEKEYRLFYLFATNKERIFTTEELLVNIWDERTEKERVRHYIKKLRNKIGDNGRDPRLLMHETGAGYYLKGF